MRQFTAQTKVFKGDLSSRWIIFISFIFRLALLQAPPQQQQWLFKQ
jgi:hypothetical protein